MLPQPPLLLVTDRSQARLRLPQILDAAFAAGCRWASVREKDLPPDEQIALARELHSGARRHGAVLTLHGAAELAQRAGVDGVHLPAGADAAAARRLLGPSALVGVSVHLPSEAAEIHSGAADYLVAGPAYETASKPGYGPALGTAGVRAIASAAHVPVVAIGGIEAENVSELTAAGAAGVAVMGGIMRADDVGRAVRALLDTLGEASTGTRPGA